MCAGLPWANWCVTPETAVVSIKVLFSMVLRSDGVVVPVILPSDLSDILLSVFSAVFLTG